MQSPYLEIGGRRAVLELAERFYDIMEAREPALLAVHERDSAGKVTRRARDRFGLFLLGWLGGPQEYVAQHGHPRLRMRHAGVAIDVHMRDAWMRCMLAAMEECRLPAKTQQFLGQRFTEVADFMRNVGEGEVDGR